MKMRANLLFIMMVVASISVTLPYDAAAQEEEDDFPDKAFFTGGYTMIGKMLESDSTFMGLLLLEVDSAGAGVFHRIIGSDTLSGRWGIEYAIGNEVRVVRIRWEKEGRKFECTYQWCMDFDSYPRLSGHCYETAKATDRPGMEVGFAIWPEWDDTEDTD